MRNKHLDGQTLSVDILQTHLMIRIFPTDMRLEEAEMEISPSDIR